MKIKAYSRYLFYLIFAFLPISISYAYAQSGVSMASVECGGILHSEMIQGQPYQDTILAVPAGTIIDLIVTPLGSSFNPFIFLLDSGGGEMERLNDTTAGQEESLINYQIGSSNAILRVLGAPRDYTGTISEHPISYIMNQIVNYDLYYNNTVRREAYLHGVGMFYGAYEVAVYCKSDDATPVPTLLPANFVGFPGLPPVDFSNVAKLPISVGNGVITPTGGEILGYTLDANAGDVVDLTFTRVAGNLNLGLVVLSAENQVVFQASLITSSMLNTRFTLPSAGQYTIGVFRIDLLPPAAPEATAFQVQGTLNP